MPGEVMTDPATFVRPELRALKAYHLELDDCAHKLDQNEVPYPLPRVVRERIAVRWLERDWARYGDFHADAVRADLAALHGWPMAGVLVGNGSNELLSVALEALGGPGREVLLHAPTFTLYRMFVLRAGGTPRVIGPAADLGLPYDAIRDEVERDPSRPVVLCSPNNPVGDALDVAQMEDLLKRLEAPLLLDNAYGEFCRHDYRPLLRRHRHLAIFRTFSKAWSLAGQRVGYVLADPSLVTELIKIKLPYNLDLASVVAAREALAARPAVDRRVRALLGRRPQWARVFADHGFEVFDSQANFLLVRHPRAAVIKQALDARGIRLRDVSGYPGLADCLRVSVGSGRDLRAVAAALSRIEASDFNASSEESES